MGTLTITASSGSVTGTKAITVTDSQVAVNDLVLALSSSTIDNSGGDSVTLTVTAVDAKRNTVSAVPVTLSLDDSAAVATPSATVTDSAGQLTAALGIGSDKTNRVFTITATSGTVTRTASLQVTGASLTSTYASAVSPGTSGNTIRYLLTDTNALPMAGQTITVSAAGLSTVTGTTDSAGSYVFTYKAPTATGALSVVATAGGTSNTAAIQVQTSGTVPVATGTVSSATVNVAPNTVAVNESGSTTNQMQVRALFVNSSSKGIANMRVRFDLAGDANSVGGSFANGSTMLYSGSDGAVTTSYIPGTKSSPTNGLTIRACYSKEDFAADTCPNAVTTVATVTNSPISVSIGTNGTIETGTDDLTYIKRFAVLVADSAGNPMPGVTVSATVDLIQYAKGYYAVSGTAWAKVAPTTICTAEDTNRNGVLDTGEDTNGSGALEPRKADVVVSVVNGTTDADGIAVVKLEYLQAVGSWVNMTLKVTATGVSGTEGTDAKTAWLWVPADEINDTSNSPPFQRSPYGTATACSNKN